MYNFIGLTLNEFNDWIMGLKIVITYNTNTVQHTMFLVLIISVILNVTYRLKLKYKRLI